MHPPLRGRFYWTRLPDEPDETVRPALVVSGNVRNRLANDVMLVPASSQIRLAPTHVVLEPGMGGLRERSVLKCEHLVTVSKSRLVEGPLGAALPPETMRAVVAGLLRALDVPIA